MDITIVESKEHLADLLYGENDKRRRKRLHPVLAQIRVGDHAEPTGRPALQEPADHHGLGWARRYESLDSAGFLGMDYKGGGHLRIIPWSVIGELGTRLGTAEGFGSFAEIRAWLKRRAWRRGCLQHRARAGQVRPERIAQSRAPVLREPDPEAVDEFKKNRPNRWQRSPSPAWGGTPASATGSRTKATSA